MLTRLTAERVLGERFADPLNGSGKRREPDPARQSLLQSPLCGPCSHRLVLDDDDL